MALAATTEHHEVSWDGGSSPVPVGLLPGYHTDGLWSIKTQQARKGARGSGQSGAGRRARGTRCCLFKGWQRAPAAQRKRRGAAAARRSAAATWRPATIGAAAPL